MLTLYRTARSAPLRLVYGPCVENMNLEWLEDALDPSEEPHARAVAVVKILIAVAIIAALIAVALVGAAGLNASLG
jgi:hypothetical protein